MKMNLRGLVLVAAVMLFGAQGCGSSKGGIFSKSWFSTLPMRELAPEERAKDFDELLTLFKTYYGPYSYKESLLKLNIEQVASQLKTQAMNAKTDEEFAGYIMQFGALLKDGHVQIQMENSASGIWRYKVALSVTPLEGKAIVASIGDEMKKATAISVGDEVLEVDGKPTMSYLPLIQKYKSWARDASNQHALFYVFMRPSFMTDLVPTSNSVRIKVKTTEGNTIAMDIPWETEKYNKEMDKFVPNRGKLDLRVAMADDYNAAFENHRGQMGQVDPIFVTPETIKKYKFVKVYPSDAARKKFGLEEKEKPPIYAALYRYSGKNVLLVRQATYSPDDFKTKVYMKAYMALFDEYQDMADVLVLDQTHNPGGSYCADFYDLFARDGDRQGVQYCRADRKWINDLRINWPKEETEGFGTWDARMLEAWSLTVEKAYDQRQLLSEAIPLFTGYAYSQKREATWTKPMLVLADELAGSCGDIFPMLIKANKRAKIFGQNTMGLGGNVEEVGILPNSRIHVRLTRGLFFPYNDKAAPQASDFVENNGVAPDYPYTHTISDFRGGYVDYVKAFSDKAVAEIGN